MARSSSKSDDGAGQGGRSLVGHMRKAWGESPFYQAQLKGPAPDRLFHQPEDQRTPDADLAKSLARGRIALGDENIDCAGELETLWDQVKEGGPLYAYLQEFSWLLHLNALGQEGQAPARALLEAWLDRYERWSAETWGALFYC